MPYLDKLVMAGVATALAAAVTTPVMAGPTIDAIKSRGVLICGANGNRAGFSFVNSEGEWQGMDTDVCRAVATAVLGDPEKVEFVKVTSQTRFPALQTGEMTS